MPRVRLQPAVLDLAPIKKGDEFDAVAASTAAVELTHKFNKK